jgi:prolyl-tRNA synthetase
MGATFLDDQGKERAFEMGCYGIGVTRIVGAAIEQNHDERGIVWPDPIAPFVVAIVPLGYRRSEAVRRAADELYGRLQAAGIEVLLDDRDERPGVLLADVELIGIPHRVVIGDRGLKDGKIEYQRRRDTAPSPVPAADAFGFLRERLCAGS